MRTYLSTASGTANEFCEWIQVGTDVYIPHFKYHVKPHSCHSVVSKVIEKLVNNRLVDHIEECGLFTNFQFGFRPSQSTADLLTVVS